MQAARGTSLSDHQEGSDPSPALSTIGSRRRAIGLLAVLAGLGYAADQATKIWAVARLSEGDVAVPGGFLTLHLVRNPGAAFSTGTEYTLALTCFAMAAVVVVVWVARRVRSLLWATALGLLLAGVCGNLTDRLLREPGPMRGHVIDFLQLPNWPVFNLADVAINLAAGLILLQAFRGVRVDGTPVEAEEAAEPEGVVADEAEVRDGQAGQDEARGAEDGRPREERESS